MNRVLRLTLAIPLLATNGCTDAEVPSEATDPLTVDDDDDDATSPQGDPWPNGEPPVWLTCDPHPQASGVLCNLQLPDQFDNPVELYRWYGRPFVLQICRTANGEVSDCVQYLEQWQSIRNSHPSVDWITLLMDYGGTPAIETAEELGAVVANSSPVLRSESFVVPALPESSAGRVTMIGVDDQMQYSSWYPAYVAAEELSDFVNGFEADMN